MKVVVCIKQVPDTKGGVKFKPDGTLDRAAMLTIMNPDDKAGLEAALRLKDQYGAEVTVESLLASSAISKAGDGVKILGNGELTKKLTVKVNAVSETAKSKIEAAGGTVELI